MTGKRDAWVLGQQWRGSIGGIGRFRTCADTGSAADRADSDQGADRDYLDSRRHALDRLHSRSGGAEPRLARPSQAGLPLRYPGSVYSVRAVGACGHQPAPEASPRRAGIPAIPRRADRNLDADDCARAAYRDHGLGFVVPLAYFIFIILSTLRLDFWLSTFTGFVAAAELLAMAMFYHSPGNADPEPELCYHAARSPIVLVC